MGICCGKQISKKNEQNVISLNEKETQELGKENNSLHEEKKEESEEVCWTQYNTINPNKKFALRTINNKH